MEVKPGYKQTEVGVIPDDWDVKKLKDVAEIRSGIAKNSRAVVANPVEISYLRVANVQDGYLDLSDISTITLSRDDINRYTVMPGDVLMNEGGDLDKLGRGAIWGGDLSPIVHQNHVFVVRCKKGILPEFLNAWTSGSASRRYFLVAGKQTTNLASINKSSLGGLPIALPCPSEQQKIAEALNELDSLIQSLNELTAKKRDIKQAAMQELLTGKRRLPGFEGEWEVKRLGDIGTFFKGSGVTRDQSQGGQLACIRYGELYTAHDNIIREVCSWISPTVAEAAFDLRTGDILFAGSGETKEDIGKCAAFVNHIEAYAGGDIVILRPRGCDSRFLGYFLNCSSIARQKASRGQGDAVVHISSSALSGIVIKIPDRQEQTSIADILVEMDAEIDMLEQQLSKTRALKQAMMQELLTGRIRLQ